MHVKRQNGESPQNKDAAKSKIYFKGKARRERSEKTNQNKNRDKEIQGRLGVNQREDKEDRYCGWVGRSHDMIHGLER